MADVRQPVMEGVAYDINSGSPDRGREFSRLKLARSLYRGKQNAAFQRAVEFEIVPRLLLAHQNQIKAAPADLDYPDEVKAFAELTLGRSEDAACAHIQVLHEHGWPLERIYLDLLAPTARYLKHQWLNDERDFADVTLALWRLQHLLREFSAAFRGDCQKATGLRALLVPGPGEPHDLGNLMFGLVLFGEFFRRDGWETWIEPASEASQLSTVIHNEWFDVVEFMVSGERRLDELAANIKLIRKTSLNRSLGVLVCGQIFAEHPELVLLVGGDMPASDPRDAAYQAQNLVRAIANRE